MFPEVDGVPYQHVLDTGTALETAGLRLEAEHAEEDGLAAALTAFAGRGFDLTAEPPLRARLFTLAPDRHVLALVLHHVAGDGWSTAPLARDLITAYLARSRDRMPSFAPLPVQYADYALWQRELLGEESDPESLVGRQIAFWRSALAGLPEQLELPADRPRPAAASHRGGSVPVILGAEVRDGLAALAREANASLFMVVRAALAALLTRLGAGTDIPIGSPIAGRTDEALDDLVGMFVNTLVLRADTGGNPRFRELVGRVRETDLAAYAHQDLPFERLVEIVNPVRSMARHPLFQVALTLQNNPAASLDLDGLAIEMEPLDPGVAKFDLLVSLTETAGGLEGVLEYAADLFDRATAEAIAVRFVRLLRAVAADPGLRIGEIEIMDDAERDTILHDWAGTGTAPGVPSTIVEEFEAQVARSPGAVAVTCGPVELTYGGLDARAGRLAGVLAGLGVGPERFVALLVPRSVELVVAVVGVLKAGGAYVPVDPAYPVERVGFMVEDAAPMAVVTVPELVGSAPPGLPVVVLEADGAVSAAPAAPAAVPVRRVLPEHPAYVIFTSGSTGRPKGVVVPHGNVTRLLAATEGWFGFDETDVWTLFHSYAFDFSVWELWGALLYGGRLVVVPFEVSRSPGEFAGLLAEQGVTVLNQTPSAFYQLMQAERERPEADLPLRYVVFGGEALEPGRLADWYDRYRDDAPALVNMYGITETTVHVTYAPLDREAAVAGAVSAIGVGIPDLRVFVLDEWLRPVPVGVVGELYVAGAGLARGYA
ncbi:non-ribosomal peptide synthetase, partial [Planomonospora venezuelensis]|nr:amino acid adenylation domain-containing protein [Planomonospora venezuelensis]